MALGCFRRPDAVVLAFLLSLAVGCGPSDTSSTGATGSAEGPVSQDAVSQDAVSQDGASQDGVPPSPGDGASPAMTASGNYDSSRLAAGGTVRPAAQVRRALVTPEGVPAGMKACRGCHQQVVDTYLADHAMAASLGPLDERLRPPAGSVARPSGDRRYEITDDASIIAHGADGGQRRQRLVGWIGAGVFDVSWVGDEVDVLDGEATGRLFFAPVETLREHGNQLAPFDLTERGAGLDLALTQGCLTCHTLTPLVSLPNAAVADGSQSLDHVFPSNGLGSDAMAQLEPLGCEACHGDGEEHLRRVTAIDEDFGDDLGLASLGRLPAPVQRDVCARCHLQGDARLDLVEARVDSDRPLAAQIPVLVPVRQGEDFRFVGQLERLAESACFRVAEAMTCTTCHAPHRGVAAQGIEAFEAVCQSCHGGDAACSRPAELTVEKASGRMGRSQGCVDCHMRRSQPFDLPHVASVDHWIRRRIPHPRDDTPHRQFADADGALEIYDDGRLAPAFASASGQRWRDGVEAIALLTLGRLDDAVQRFDRFPSPGSVAARRPSAPSPLVPLETEVVFHQSRGLALMSKGRFDEALAAFDDALALDPKQASVLLARAQLRFDLGQVGPALQDTQTVIDLYPQAEQPWDMRARMAERLGRVDLAQAAFQASDQRWPSNATQLFKLGLLQRQVGLEEEARAALQKAYLLDPDLEIGGAGRLVDHLAQP